VQVKKNVKKVTNFTIIFLLQLTFLTLPRHFSTLLHFHMYSDSINRCNVWLFFGRCDVVLEGVGIPLSLGGPGCSIGSWLPNGALVM
jgi:hypothetical protein